MRPDSSICISCKGRLLCGLKQCPHLQKTEVERSIRQKVEQLGTKGSLFGPSPPNLFVTWNGYPDVRCGPLVSISEHSIEDNPSAWFGLPLEEIITMRSLLFRPLQQTHVVKINRQVEELQDAALSINPVDIEAKVGKPHFTLSFSSRIQPMGPYATATSVKLAENPKIPKAVDMVLDEKLKATQAAEILFGKGFDVYYLTKILSAGTLGIKKRMVPTRWSITATDDMIGKSMISEIKNFDTISNFLVGSAEYMSNHFEVLLMPGNWEFENFEAWAPGTVWSKGLSEPQVVEDYESNGGKKGYSVQGGGYYASRYAATEALVKMRKQAKVVVFREIYEGYQIPLGVWVVRETAVRAYKDFKPFSTLNEALSEISSRIRLPISAYKKQSKILPQTRIIDF